MCESVRTVRLYGVLGTTFGREFQLSVSFTKRSHPRIVRYRARLRAVFEYQQAAWAYLRCIQWKA